MAWSSPLIPILLALVLWPVAPAPSCSLSGRFGPLLQRLPVDPGACIGAPRARFPTVLRQSTENGLLVQRRDGSVAFTDGYQTWVLGPRGFEVRLSGQRFSWEPNASEEPLAAEAIALPGAAAALPSLPPGVPFRGRLLITDRFNRRLLAVGPSGAVTWQFPAPGQTLPIPFGPPDDAFFSPTFRSIVVNSEDDQTVTAIAVRSGTVRWQVGTPGRPGSAIGSFYAPDDAVPALDGTVTVADIRNCRLVHLSARGTWLGVQGNGVCRHQPPRSFDLPNGAFPTSHGGLVVTEIRGAWVDWLNADGTVRWATHAPVRYPSDAIPYPDGSVLLTDFSWPGQVLRLNASGRVLWRYAPRGADALDHPSIAIPLAANRVAISDDRHNRVLVVDPTTNAVVWRFSGPPGSSLRTPDGLAFRPG